jgi:hypothetical protein
MSEALALDPALHHAARAGVAGVLLWAALHKARDRSRFVHALAGYALVPPRALAAVATVLIAAELTIAAALLTPGGGAVPAGAAVVLLLTYTGAVVATLGRGVRIECGCTGPAGQPVSWGLVGRNALLLGAALAGLLPATSRQTVWIDAVTVVAGAVALVLLYTAVNQVLANRERVAALARHAHLASAGDGAHG